MHWLWMVQVLAVMVPFIDFIMGIGKIFNLFSLPYPNQFPIPLAIACFSYDAPVVSDRTAVVSYRTAVVSVKTAIVYDKTAVVSVRTAVV